jgi:hypothetical protein
MRFHHRKSAVAWPDEFREAHAGQGGSPEMIKVITRNFCSNEQFPYLHMALVKCALTRSRLNEAAHGEPACLAVLERGSGAVQMFLPSDFSNYLGADVSRPSQRGRKLTADAGSARVSGVTSGPK